MWAHRAELPSREAIHCLPQPDQLPSVDIVGMLAPHIERGHLSMPLQNSRVDTDPAASSDFASKEKESDFSSPQATGKEGARLLCPTVATPVQEMRRATEAAWRSPPAALTRHAPHEIRSQNLVQLKKVSL